MQHILHNMAFTINTVFYYSYSGLDCKSSKHMLVESLGPAQAIMDDSEIDSYVKANEKKDEEMDNEEDDDEESDEMMEDEEEEVTILLSPDRILCLLLSEGAKHIYKSDSKYKLMYG